MEKVYGVLRNLWAVIDSTPFAIWMQLAKTFLIPVLAYNNIARYVFIKGRRDHISQFYYRIFEVNFDNQLNIKCLILLHKIITLEQPIHLFRRIIYSIYCF